VERPELVEFVEKFERTYILGTRSMTHTVVADACGFLAAGLATRAVIVVASIGPSHAQQLGGYRPSAA
jgi:hypothetical protein